MVRLHFEKRTVCGTVTIAAIMGDCPRHPDAEPENLKKRIL
jgi:hypothetical protein